MSEPTQARTRSEERDGTTEVGTAMRAPHLAAGAMASRRLSRSVGERGEEALLHCRPEVGQQRGGTEGLELRVGLWPGTSLSRVL